MAMDMKQLEEKVKDIIVEELGVERDKLTNDASFMEDLGADSLDTVELVMAFEKEFDIDIPDEEAEKLRTVGAAMSYLHEKIDHGPRARDAGRKRRGQHMGRPRRRTVGGGSDHPVRFRPAARALRLRGEGLRPPAVHR